MTHCKVQLVTPGEGIFVTNVGHVCIYYIYFHDSITKYDLIVNISVVFMECKTWMFKIRFHDKI